MTSNIYALLVGIDDYIAPVKKLQGCINDVMAIEEYLRTRVKTEGWNLHLKVLKDSEATRQGIIDCFRKHLCQANSNDVAFFYYSGHGSQELAPKEFWEFGGEKLNQALVCYDSRKEGYWNLADKELAKLIAEVAEKDPHITLILDCCHSGTGTRDAFQETAVRQYESDKRYRPLESFIFSPEEIENIRSFNRQASGWSLPRGKHILFAACQDLETAKEYKTGGKHRGAFCYFLTKTLSQTQGNLTYRDLFKRTNALVRSVFKQSPQLEATDSRDLDQLFLGGAVSARNPYYTVSYHKQYGWIIDGGAVHGVPRPDGGETMRLALFPITAKAEDLRKLSNKFADAQVTEVLPQLSQITTDPTNLDRQQTFKAVITSLPLPPLGVRLVGEEEGVQLLKQALKNINDGQSSVYVREVNESETAEFKVIALNGEYLITRPADGVPIVNQIPGYTSSSANKIVERLEHIARWTNLSQLQSPANSQISASAVKLEIYQKNQVVEDSQIRLNYYLDDKGKWNRPAFKIKLKNTSEQTLYCALLELTEQFSIGAGFFEAGYIKLKSNEECWVLGGKAIRPSVPDELWRQGVTEYQDILKLIVCSNEFDARLLEQPKLDSPRREYTHRNVGTGTLNRLMNRWQSRDLLSDEPVEEYDDWVATQVVIKTIRPLDTTTVPHSGNGVSLGVGVTLKAHPNLQAKASLTSISSSTRNLDNDYLPPVLRDNPHSQPFVLTNSSEVEANANALELSNVDTATISTVTRENPLKLIVDRPLAPQEKVIPIAYDGEFYLPLGIGYSHNGKTEIRLERLPELESGERSLTGAFKIYFQKVLSEKLGLEFPYPRLAIAKVNASEEVSYETDVEEIKQQVAQANKIVLFIHGIIGDTESLLPAMQKATWTVTEQEKPLAEMCDLILAFDYENINTSIEENARSLKQSLEEIGLGENHGKQLHIVAHSMGGLISRWLIEREGGNKIINHLVMLGTPNAGSPWSTIHDFATALFTFALNSISPFKILPSLLTFIEKIDVSFDQMQPGSDFLKSLAASPDPGIPYTIIAGNNLAPSVFGETNKLQQLMEKLKDKSIDLAFFDQLNDIAVTVSSITSVNNARSPQPQIHEVDCNHLDYFIDTKTLSILSTALMESTVGK